MKVAYLCTQDISNQIFLQTLEKYNLEIQVFIENNKKYRKTILNKKFQKLNLLGKLLFPIDVLCLLIYRKRINFFLKKKLNFISQGFNQYKIFETQDSSLPS